MLVSNVPEVESFVMGERKHVHIHMPVYAY